MAGLPSPQLQVILSVGDGIRPVLGIPASLRVAHALAAGYGLRRVIFVTDAVPAFVRAWRRQLRSLPWLALSPVADSLPAMLDEQAPVLVLSADGMPDPADLLAFIAAAAGRPAATGWVWSGRTVAVYHSMARELLAVLPPAACGFPTSALAQPSAERVVAPATSWYDLRDPKESERAETDLLRSLRKDTDGYLARFDRHLSIALSRALLRTPVTPNAVTATGLVVGLLGAGLLGGAGHLTALAGAGLLWTTCVLDGCDGELARLKLLGTRFGARFDVVADNLVHVAVFVALPIHLRLTGVRTGVLPAGAVLLAGVLLSMASVWWLLLRRPSPRRGALALFYERVASRDFIYVIIALAILRHLEWFLWAAAIGAHVFWLSLWGLAWRRR